jgi:uncharacterized protein
MKRKVFFIPAATNEKLELIHQKIQMLFEKANLEICFEAEDFIAIKTHFGEDGNTTHIPANYFPPFIKKLKDLGGKPFLTDTCVLYASERSDAVKHHHLAEKHGFTIDQTGAPVVIADGLRGRNETDVKIPGELFKKVSIATEAVVANAMIVTTHVTGHMASGIGGAIKNIGMGLASRKGKLRQHSSMKPAIISPKCTGCALCLLWCPEDAITMNGDVAVINGKKCIGCGECLTVCRFDAVRYNWKTSSSDLQKRMTEHALGAIFNKKDKVCFFSFLMNITKDCDCYNVKQTPMMNDIGILAAKDPVAIDKASLDLVKQHAGDSLEDMSYPSIDPLVQLKHGEKIGLGCMDYDLEVIEL